MKELITVASAFVIVVGLALFMYSGNQKHTTAVHQLKELNEIVEKNNNELREEIIVLKSHIRETDSIFHNRKTE